MMNIMFTIISKESKGESMYSRCNCEKFLGGGGKELISIILFNIAIPMLMHSNPCRDCTRNIEPQSSSESST
jgi:hypothetical protein